MVKFIVDDINASRIGSCRHVIESSLKPEIVKKIIRKIPLGSDDFDGTEIYILVDSKVIEQIRSIIHNCM